MRSKAGGIFGIVGGSLMMFGCVTTAIMALSVLAALARHSSYPWPETTYDFVGLMVSPFVFVAGGTLGLAGGLKALKKDNKFGAKLMFAAAAFAVVAGVLLIAPTMFLPFAVLIAGGVLSFIFVQPPQQPREEYRDRYLPPPYIPPALPPYGSPYFPPYGAPYAPPPVYPQDPPEPFGEFGTENKDGENAGASGVPPYGGYVPLRTPPAQPDPFGESGMNGSDDSAAGSADDENAGASGGDPGESDGSSDGDDE